MPTACKLALRLMSLICSIGRSDGCVTHNYLLLASAALCLSTCRYPLSEAQARLLTALQLAGRDGLLGVEEVPLTEAALGRVLADPIWAKISSPHYHASAMDGFALRAEETSGASPSTPSPSPAASRLLTSTRETAPSLGKRSCAD